MLFLSKVTVLLRWQINWKFQTWDAKDCTGGACCSDATQVDETACTDASEVWTDMECSDSTYTTQTDCITGGTWTASCDITTGGREIGETECIAAASTWITETPEFGSLSVVSTDITMDAEASKMVFETYIVLSPILFDSIETKVVVVPFVRPIMENFELDSFLILVKEVEICIAGTFFFSLFFKKNCTTLPKPSFTSFKFSL